MRVPSSRTYFDLVEEYARTQPGHPAVIWDDLMVGYAALADAARKMARALQALEVTAGSRVGLLLNNRFSYLQAALAANALGATVVPFSTWSTEPELDFLLQDSGVCCLVMLAAVGEQDFAASIRNLVPESAAAPPLGWSSQRYPALRSIVVLSTVRAKGWLFFDSISRNQSGDPLPSTDHSARDAFILYTSGSSAKPKAVRLSNKACIENGFNIGERMGLTPADRVLVAPPLFWSYGAANAWPAILSHGATMVLQSQFQPGEALDLIERHRCTALYTLPGMTNALVGHREFRRERTKTLRTGLTLGTPHDIRKAAEQLGAAEICNIYGLTETGGNCAVTWHHAPLDERADNQGPPLPGQTIRIVEAGTGNPLPAGQAGEVEVSGPYVTPGYAGASAALNDQAFTADGFLRTGDLGFLDEEARFHFIARNTEVIKRNGINVSPAEVEDAIQGVDGVASVAVAGAPSEQHGEIIVAFVIAKPSGVSTDAIRAACMDRLSRYKLPDHIELCDKLPMTETGKLARKTLKEWAARATKSA